MTDLDVRDEYLTVDRGDHRWVYASRVTVDGITATPPTSEDPAGVEAVRSMIQVIDDVTDCECVNPDCWTLSGAAFTRRARDEWPDHAVW